MPPSPSKARISNRPPSTSPVEVDSVLRKYLNAQLPPTGVGNYPQMSHRLARQHSDRWTMAWGFPQILQFYPRAGNRSRSYPPWAGARSPAGPSTPAPSGLAFLGLGSSIQLLDTDLTQLAPRREKSQRVFMKYIRRRLSAIFPFRNDHGPPAQHPDNPSWRACCRLPTEKVLPQPRSHKYHRWRHSETR